jgi:hypothetical protein
MTPRAKADYLLIKFHLSECTHGYNDVRDIHAANRCAIIAVDEIIQEIIEIDSQMSEAGLLNKNLKYWQEVKNILEKT